MNTLPDRISITKEWQKRLVVEEAERRNIDNLAEVAGMMIHERAQALESERRQAAKA